MNNNNGTPNSGTKQLLDGLSSDEKNEIGLETLSDIDTVDRLDGQFGIRANTLDEFEMADEESISGKPRPGVQYSTYAAKKTVAQGMMDIALITANANQLRYLIEFQSNAPTFYITLVLIIISIVLQLTVGIFLIFKGRYDLKGQEKLEAANNINNIVVVGVFLVTVINVFIASFSITGEPRSPVSSVANT